MSIHFYSVAAVVERLKKQAKEGKLTVERLAQKLGISLRSLYHLLDPGRDPQLASLVALSRGGATILIADGSVYAWLATEDPPPVVSQLATTPREERETADDSTV